jgi:hypothetical protein
LQRDFLQKRFVKLLKAELEIWRLLEKIDHQMASLIIRLVELQQIQIDLL